MSKVIDAFVLNTITNITLLVIFIIINILTVTFLTGLFPIIFILSVFMLIFIPTYGLSRAINKNVKLRNYKREGLIPDRKIIPLWQAGLTGWGYVELTSLKGIKSDK